MIKTRKWVTKNIQSYNNLSPTFKRRYENLQRGTPAKGADQKKKEKEELKSNKTATV